MTKYRCVTTFPEGADYAQKFLESYCKHWKVPIYVYYEGARPDFKHRLVRFFSLDADRERKAFLERNKGRQKPASDPGNAYRWDWDRFCHKVFALTNARNTKDTDWLIWLDADVITHDTVDEEFLAKVCQGDVSYVGRDGFTHPDCAFVAYRHSRLLSRLRHTYTSDNLFNLPEWHDSYVFKHWLDSDAGYRAVNLSPGIPGMQVFDDCVLGTKMRHLKGKARKQGLVPQIPGYSSQKEMQTVSGKPVPVSGMRPIQVKTKNCVPHERIQANVHYTLTLLEKFVTPCKKNDIIISFCSGGPSLPKYYNHIKKNREDGHLIACVKHAHDKMIEAGIVPDFCVLLDPRNHVQDFIENPHPEVIYLVSSMVHPTTLDRLLEKNAKVLGYHAHVGAEEDQVLKTRNRSGMLIGGGCSAAMRGLSVFWTMGFREFWLYGYDLCYPEKPFEGDKIPKKADGTPEYLHVDCLGKRFWTDPEKIAQAQDFEKIMKEDQRIEIKAFGDGIVPHLWAAMQRPLPSYEDLIGSIRPSPGIEGPVPDAG